MSKNGKRSRMSEHNTHAIVPIAGEEQEKRTHAEVQTVSDAK